LENKAGAREVGRVEGKKYSKTSTKRKTDSKAHKESRKESCSLQGALGNLIEWDSEAFLFTCNLGKQALVLD